MLESKVLEATFLERLRRCERRESQLNEYDREFIYKLRRGYDSRDDGIGTPWDPTTKQWNYLTRIYESL